MVLFKAEKVTEAITRIVMPYVCAYLIEGKDRAVLVDTGFGYGDLKAFVEELTQLPYDVLLTHAHPDHAGGSAQFEKVYLNPREFIAAQRDCSIENRRAIRQYVTRKSGVLEDKVELWQPQRQADFTPLEEEDVFDLGGLSLLPVLVPGHSQGIMCFIIKEERVAIFGDACSDPTLLNLDASTSIREHLKGLLHLRSFEGLFDHVLINHTDFHIAKEVLANNILLAQNIIHGVDDKIRIRMSGKVSYSARPNRLKNKYQMVPVGNIIYTEEKL
ncbi:MBL fold metallo-hydrolase [Fundicoccus sp. Sow4_D5]|uniref:MBL fold metallo-hydrolase n=1 Tax=unclassified Fundicoccus TaxID=2761543 RepID=UPI003F93B1CC